MPPRPGSPDSNLEHRWVRALRLSLELAAIDPSSQSIHRLDADPAALLTDGPLDARGADSDTLLMRADSARFLLGKQLGSLPGNRSSVVMLSLSGRVDHESGDPYRLFRPKSEVGAPSQKNLLQGSHHSPW